VDGPAIFGANLRALREQKGMTQDQLAERAHMDAPTIRRYERGVRDPTIKSLTRLARALDTTVSELVRDIA
jgi:transcriptional regulator with XRE-family HTH domain